MVLNPYEFLGVTPNSTTEDVRKQYYALACLCHPDRGGTTEQMQVLQNAYTYVQSQVALNRTDTFEQLEAEFKEFCETQTKAPPRFNEIYRDFCLPRFNEAFQGLASTDVVEGAFAPGGYETVPSAVSLLYSPTETQRIPQFTSEMVIYEEPLPLCATRFSTARDLSNPTITDFSCTVGKVHASDYHQALSAPVPPAPSPLEELDVMKEFVRRTHAMSSPHQRACP